LAEGENYVVFKISWKRPTVASTIGSDNFCNFSYPKVARWALRMDPKMVLIIS
jgi:hypothetical protein